jgi:hypothetical protein
LIVADSTNEPVRRMAFEYSAQALSQRQHDGHMGWPTNWLGCHWRSLDKPPRMALADAMALAGTFL